MTKDDEMKSYMLNLQSGRLRYLDFEVSLDNLDRVKNIKGMGSSCIKKIREYLETGGRRCSRIEEFEKDELRMAMKAIKIIWGVGQATVSKSGALHVLCMLRLAHQVEFTIQISQAKVLVNQGYRTIEEVRRDVKSGALSSFNANQKIGLKYYDDFLEKMDRKEVEVIADIVTKAVLERYTEAKVHIMGSYRRGKNACGDIDLLITDPEMLRRHPVEPWVSS